MGYLWNFPFWNVIAIGNNEFERFVTAGYAGSPLGITLPSPRPDGDLLALPDFPLSHLHRNTFIVTSNSKASKKFSSIVAKLVSFKDSCSGRRCNCNSGWSMIRLTIMMSIRSNNIIIELRPVMGSLNMFSGLVCFKLHNWITTQIDFFRSWSLNLVNFMKMRPMCAECAVLWQHHSWHR
jgi:hypothetical protein